MVSETTPDPDRSEPHEAFTLEPAPQDTRDEDRWQVLLWAPDGDDSFPTWEAAAEATPDRPPGPSDALRRSRRSSSLADR